MRGYPLWQLAGIALLFLIAGIPVWRLTAPAPSNATLAQPTPVASAPDVQAVELQAAFVPAPAEFKVTYLGEVVLSGQGPAADFEGHWTVRLPPDGADLALQARWPESVKDGHVAARLMLRFADGRQVEKAFWGEAGKPMVEVFGVSAK